MPIDECPESVEESRSTNFMLRGTSEALALWSIEQEGYTTTRLACIPCANQNRSKPDDSTWDGPGCEYTCQKTDYPTTDGGNPPSYDYDKCVWKCQVETDVLIMNLNQDETMTMSCKAPHVNHICQTNQYLQIDTSKGNRVGKCLECTNLQLAANGGEEFYHDISESTSGEQTCAKKCLDGWITQTNPDLKCVKCADTEIECSQGKYYSQDYCRTDNNLVDAGCQQCTTSCTPPVSYFKQECGLTQDAICEPCSECRNGVEYLINQCNSNTDTTCAYCSMCEAGQWDAGGCDGIVDRDCQTCPGGYWCHNGERHQCPPNSTSLTGSISELDCVCEFADHYAEKGVCHKYQCNNNEYGRDGRCVACPSGSFRTAGDPVEGVNNCRCEEGYWKNFAGDTPGCQVCSVECQDRQLAREYCPGTTTSDPQCECITDIPSILSVKPEAEGCMVQCVQDKAVIQRTHTYNAWYDSEGARVKAVELLSGQIQGVQDLSTVPPTRQIQIQVEKIRFLTLVPIYDQTTRYQYIFWFSVTGYNTVYETRMGDGHASTSQALWGGGQQSECVLGGEKTHCQGVPPSELFLNRPSGLTVNVEGRKYYIADEAEKRIIETSTIVGDTWNVVEVMSNRHNLQPTAIVHVPEKRKLYFHASNTNNIYSIETNENSLPETLTPESFNQLSRISYTGGGVLILSTASGIHKVDVIQSNALTKDIMSTVAIDSPDKMVAILEARLILTTRNRRLVVNDIDQQYSTIIGVTIPERHMILAWKTDLFTTNHNLLLLDTETGTVDLYVLSTCAYGSVWDGRDTCVNLPCSRTTQCTNEEVASNDGLSCLCAPGYYRTTITSSSCLICPKGSYCPGDEDKVQCSSVVSGSTSTVGSISEQQCNCPPGKYVFKGDSSDTCTLCPPGFWCPQHAILESSFQGYFKCPPGRASQKGSSKPTDCECLAGWFEDESGQCIDCTNKYILCQKKQTETQDKTIIPFTFVIRKGDIEEFKSYVHEIEVHPTTQATLTVSTSQTVTTGTGICPEYLEISRPDQFYPGVVSGTEVVELYCDFWVIRHENVIYSDAVSSLSFYIRGFTANNTTPFTVFDVQKFENKQKPTAAPIVVVECTGGKMASDDDTCRCGYGYQMDKKENKCKQCQSNTFKDSISDSTSCRDCPAGAEAKPGSDVCICTGEGFSFTKVNTEMVCKDDETGEIYREETTILGLSPVYFALIVVGLVISGLLLCAITRPMSNQTNQERGERENSLEKEVKDPLLAAKTYPPPSPYRWQMPYPVPLPYSIQNSTPPPSNPYPTPYPLFAHPPFQYQTVPQYTHMFSGA
eukprot:3939584-Rhodomonas_salina.2